MDRNPLRAFISYTAQDLSAHADVVLAALRALEVVAIDHRSAPVTGAPSVAWCKEQIKGCDVVVVLVAHRYGWVPDANKGGDGQSSITQIEVRYARQLQKEILPFLISDDATWPVSQIEALTNPGVHRRLESFKAELREFFAGFFSDPNSLDGPVSRSIERLKSRLAEKHLSASLRGTSRTGAPISTVPWIFSRDSPPTVSERMDPSLPKRVLCIDSATAGDIGVTFGYLLRLERLLQERYAEPDFRLCDYFDLVAGSGLGAIIAADLANGRSVAEAGDWVSAQLPKIREKRNSIVKRMRHSHDPSPLANALKDRFGDRDFDPAEYCTGLAVIGTRLELGIPIHVSNHPDEADKHPALLLHQVLLGFNSLLTIFPPVVVDLGAEGFAALSEADIVGASNPSLYLLLMITNRRFCFRWPLGLNRLAVFSVGGLVRSNRKPPDEVINLSIFEQIQLLANSLIQGTSHTTRLIMDSLAFNDQKDEENSVSSLTYYRFEVTSDASAFASGELASLAAQADTLRWDECSARWNDLLRLGQAAAEVRIAPSSFIPAFDVRHLPR